MLFHRVIERPKVYVRAIRDYEATIEEQFGSLSIISFWRDLLIWKRWNVIPNFLPRTVRNGRIGVVSVKGLHLKLNVRRNEACVDSLVNSKPLQEWTPEPQSAHGWRSIILLIAMVTLASGAIAYVATNPQQVARAAAFPPASAMAPKTSLPPPLQTEPVTYPNPFDAT